MLFFLWEGKVHEYFPCDIKIYLIYMTLTLEKIYYFRFNLYLWIGFIDIENESAETFNDFFSSLGYNSSLI